MSFIQKGDFVLHSKQLKDSQTSLRFDYMCLINRKKLICLYMSLWTIQLHVNGNLQT